uniref:Uncharacterized protein n=1 Tax=Quercus lobata TaxID=97700 RepID=A0A7N2KS78_QUELO
MASSTSILPNTSIPLDDQCSNHQLNQKDQASSMVESSLVQPNTPSPLPASNWGSARFMIAEPVHLPQQNLSTPPPNHESFHIPMAEPGVAQPQNHVQAQIQMLWFEGNYTSEFSHVAHQCCFDGNLIMSDIGLPEKRVYHAALNGLLSQC